MIDMIPFDSTESSQLTEKYLAKLIDFESAAKVLSEVDFRRKFKISDSNMPFAWHPPINESLNVYRSRSVKSFKEDRTNPASFSYYPLESVDETHPSLQRCNFSGQSVFYGSFSLITNFREISDFEEDAEVYVSKWHIEANSNMNLYRIYPPEGVMLNNDYHGILKLENLSVLNSPCQKYLQYFGEIMMREGGDNHKQNYLPTALLCSSIFNFEYKGEPLYKDHVTEYHGIAYPSTKVNGGAEVNVALKPSFVDKHLTLECVAKVKIAHNLSFVLKEIGFCDGGKIAWTRPMLYEDNFYPQTFHLIDNNDCIVELTDGQIFDENHNAVTDLQRVFSSQFESICTCLYKFSHSVSFDKQYFDKKKFDVFYMSVTNWTFEKNYRIIHLKYIRFFFSYHIVLEPIQEKFCQALEK